MGELDDGMYFGLVKCPNTYGRWAYGYFSKKQLEKAGACPINLDLEEDAPLYPDGGEVEYFVGIFET